MRKIFWNILSSFISFLLVALLAIGPWVDEAISAISVYNEVKDIEVDRIQFFSNDVSTNYDKFHYIENNKAYDKNGNKLNLICDIYMEYEEVIYERNVFDFKGGLSSDECLVSEYVANKYGIEIDSQIRIYSNMIDDMVYFNVIGLIKSNSSLSNKNYEGNIILGNNTAFSNISDVMVFSHNDKGMLGASEPYYSLNFQTDIINNAKNSKNKAINSVFFICLLISLSSSILLYIFKIRKNSYVDRLHGKEVNKIIFDSEVEILGSNLIAFIISLIIICLTKYLNFASSFIEILLPSLLQMIAIDLLYIFVLLIHLRTRIHVLNKNDSCNSDCIDFADLTYQIGRKKVTFCCDGTEVINKGDTLLVSGDNGAGKSTFLKLFAVEDGNVKVSNGHLHVLGVNAFNTNKAKLLQKIAYISQNDDFKKGFTVKDALLYPTCLVSHDKRTKELLMDEFNLLVDEKEKKYIYWNNNKNYIDTSSLVSKLSGGERKFVHIVAECLKAIVLKSNIVIADEPLNDLNRKLINPTIEWFKRIRNNDSDLIMIIVSHLNSIDKLFDKNTKKLEFKIIDDEKETKDVIVNLSNYEHEIKGLDLSSKIKENSKTNKVISWNDFNIYPRDKEIRYSQFELYEKDVLLMLGDNGSGKSSLLLAFNNRNDGRLNKFDGSNILDDKGEIASLDYLNNVVCDFKQVEEGNNLSTISYWLKSSTIYPNEEKYKNYLRYLKNKKIPSIYKKLSGGEKQLVRLYSQLLKANSNNKYDRKLLLLDEPSNNLHENELEAFCKEFSNTIKNKAASIIVTHDLKIIEMLDDGIISCVGYKIDNTFVFSRDKEVIIECMEKYLKNE